MGTSPRTLSSIFRVWCLCESEVIFLFQPHRFHVESCHVSSRPSRVLDRNPLKRLPNDAFNRNPYLTKMSVSMSFDRSIGTATDCCRWMFCSHIQDSELEGIEEGAFSGLNSSISFLFVDGNALTDSALSSLRHFRHICMLLSIRFSSPFILHRFGREIYSRFVRMQRPGEERDRASTHFLSQYFLHRKSVSSEKSSGLPVGKCGS